MAGRRGPEEGIGDLRVEGAASETAATNGIDGLDGDEPALNGSLVVVGGEEREGRTEALRKRRDVFLVGAHRCDCARVGGYAAGVVE